MRAWIRILMAAFPAVVLTSCGGPEFQAVPGGDEASTMTFDGSPQAADSQGADGPYDGRAGSDVVSLVTDAGSDVPSPPESGLDGGGAHDTSALEVGPPDGGPGETTIDMTPSKDAYVEDGLSADTNFGASSQLRVKGNDGVTLDRNTWLSFDISGFSSVSSAKLSVWVVTIDTGNTNPVPNEFLYAPTASDGWSESTIAWNTAPAAGQQVAQTTVVDSQLNTWVEVDVTVPVSTDSDGVSTIVITSPPYTGRGLTYSSREGANRPVLRVTGIPR
jgi:hypothetical protein